MEKKKKSKKRDVLWLQVLGALALIGIPLAIPFTRHLIILILPLGSGWDDLIFAVVFVAVILILSVRGVISLRTGTLVVILRRIFDPSYDHYEQSTYRSEEE